MTDMKFSGRPFYYKVETVMGAFDFNRYERLREAYDEAVAADEDHFFFDGVDYDYSIYNVLASVYQRRI